LFDEFSNRSLRGDDIIPLLDYPQLELSNNLAENSMRPVALGRRNWIHIGSEQAGPRVAAGPMAETPL
jgi:hypothetical protein